MIASGGEGDEVGGAADDGLAGDGTVFVVVAQVGVELAGESVLGVEIPAGKDNLPVDILRDYDYVRAQAHATERPYQALQGL